MCTQVQLLNRWKFVSQFNPNELPGKCIECNVPLVVLYSSGELVCVVCDDEFVTETDMVEAEALWRIKYDGTVERCHACGFPLVSTEDWGCTICLCCSGGRPPVATGEALLIWREEYFGDLWRTPGSGIVEMRMVTR